MYEKLTDNARKVMQLANSEAQRFNHDYIGTEHILLGLAKEVVAGTATKVLNNLGVSLPRIRLEVNKIIQSGPDIVTMGKLPQTPRAKKVIEYAMDEARDMNHNYIGTEHILLGMLREAEGVASQVLTSLGLRLKEVRQEILRVLAGIEEPVLPRRGEIELSGLHAKAVLSSQETIEADVEYLLQFLLQLREKVKAEGGMVGITIFWTSGK